MNHLRQKAISRLFQFFEGSEVLDESVAGGLDAFKDLVNRRKPCGGRSPLRRLLVNVVNKTLGQLLELLRAISSFGTRTKAPGMLCGPGVT